MDKQTLSNYGWIVICVLVLSVMIALATPFGTFVSNAVQNTTEGLSQTEQNAMEKGLAGAGIKLENVEFDDVNTVGGSKESAKDNALLNHKDIIPEGAAYYVGVTSNELGNYSGATAIYTSGQNFPSTVKEGDVFGIQI